MNLSYNKVSVEIVPTYYGYRVDIETMAPRPFYSLDFFQDGTCIDSNGREKQATNADNIFAILRNGLVHIMTRGGSFTELTVEEIKISQLMDDEATYKTEYHQFSKINGGLAIDDTYNNCQIFLSDTAVNAIDLLLKNSEG